MNPYTLHISLYDLLFLGTIFIGLTFSVLLLFKKGKSRFANRFLSLALFTVVLWMLGVLNIDSRLPLQFSLAFGPLVFFYVLKLTIPEYKFCRKDWLHFIPVLLEQINLPDPLLRFLTFSSVAIYLYLSHRLIERFYSQLEFSGGDRYRNELRWLHNLLKGFSLVWLLWIPLTVVNYWALGHYSSYPMYVLVAAMMIWIAAVAHLRPEGSVKAETHLFLKPLLPSELKQKGSWLKKTVKEHRYYQDPELSLASLAEKIGLQAHELSRMLNTVLKKSFNDFINEYRVQDVIRKMQDSAYDHITLLGIAYESGFNAQSTFSRIFKQITGTAPLEYKNSLKKDYPSYNLRSYDRFGQVILPVKSNGYGMFKNYLKIAWRNMLRQRFYSLINISGLAIGLAVCMLIMLYVAHEHSYDRFHKNGDRIYTLHATIKIGGQPLSMAYMSYGTGPVVKQNQPKVKDYLRTMDYGGQVIVSDPAKSDVKFADKKLLFADAGFFNFFSFKLTSGSSSSALSKPFSVVLTKEMARKYFGDADPIGKTLTIRTDTTLTYQVTGIAESAPSNSSIDFNFIASASSLPFMKNFAQRIGEQQGLGPGSFNVYLLLKDRKDTAEVKRVMQVMVKADKKSFDDEKFSLQPLASTHLENNFGDFTNIKYLKIFPVVAILVLLLALVNYMSLSTAKATLRAKEVGVRKVTGASRKSIAKQFYVESALFAFISFVLGYLLCYLFKPLFLNTLKLNIDSSFLYSPLVLILMAGLLIVTILVAGSYPSLVLSSFNPVTTLKGKMSKQSGGVMVRKVFTTLQFSISVGLIICGVVIDRQLYYMRHAETGVNKDNVVMIRASSAFNNHYAAFTQQIKNLAGVSQVTTSQTDLFGGYNMYSVNDYKNPKALTMLPAMTVDQNFVSVVGLKWKYPPLANTTLAGKDKVVINEEAIVKLHLDKNPVGTYINTGNKVQIMGVVKDFNFTSLQQPIAPLGLFMAPDTSRFWTKYGCSLFARIKPKTNLPTLLDAMKKIYTKYDKDTPFTYTFLDDAFNNQYKAEDMLASMFSIFTVITILLATMGLFGLAAFTIEQRTKEIGIRKVLGASIVSINGLLSKDFLKLVLLSIIVASPVAWWFMHKWLQDFAYHISIAWWMFAGAGLLAVVVAVITVSYHAIRAAIANPVNSLRSE